MADRAPYTRQFHDTAAAVTNRLGRREHRIAYQSQVTGTPVPWLQPDVNDVIEQVHEDGFRDVIVAPIGFLCDHMEVLYDLDVQAKETAAACGLGFVRAATVSNHPAFVAMLSDLISAHLAQNSPQGRFPLLPVAGEARGDDFPLSPGGRGACPGLDPGLG